MSDLFSPPVPPANPYRLEDHTGHAAYKALVSCALGKWQHKQVYERMMCGICAGSGGEWPVGETPGRYLRFLREKLVGTGWTVLNDAGDVCLCPSHDVERLLAVLVEERVKEA